MPNGTVYAGDPAEGTPLKSASAPSSWTVYTGIPAKNKVGVQRWCQRFSSLSRIHLSNNAIAREGGYSKRYLSCTAIWTPVVQPLSQRRAVQDVPLPPPSLPQDPHVILQSHRLSVRGSFRVAD
jgi:hypothetical protein